MEIIVIVHDKFEILLAIVAVVRLTIHCQPHRVVYKAASMW